ncbi:MAG: hypothetical protein WA584_23575 [Pyrinomonadaceae bacterium]
MKVAKITTASGEFFTDDVSNLEKFSDSLVEIIEMSDEEYKAIPASLDAKELFDGTAK